MVLEGLVGNEDFWTIDLSDDEVPINGPTLANASKSVHLCTASHCAEINAEDATKDAQGAMTPSGGFNADKRAEEKRCLTRSEKLPNGKYRYKRAYDIHGSYCTSLDATIHARISPLVAICGMPHLIPPVH
jgi:hypothetical protein